MFFTKLRILSQFPKLIVLETRKCSTHQQIKDVLPETEYQQKLLKVAVIGMPNAGKSTFINNLMDRKVCPASSKVHTTRNNARAIFTEDDSQIVFVDTPGIVTDREIKKHNLGKSFTNDSNASLIRADVVGVIHDVSNLINREKLDIKIINLLEKHNSLPSFLVLNKIDVLKSKRKLLDIARLLTENCIRGKSTFSTKDIKVKFDHKGWRHFSEIFMVSALTGDGLLAIKEFLIKKSKPGKWMFPEQVWTDQPAEDIITNVVKATLLNFLPQEIPYMLQPCMEFFETDDDGVIKTVVIVKCPSERVRKLVAGVSDGRLRQIIQSVQEDLQSTFKNFVKINIVLQGPNKNYIPS